MKYYKELLVWKKSMELVKRVYVLLESLPKEEQYALADQMRRAVVSIPSNIAEGHERNSQKEFRQFLYIARASKAELETQIDIGVMLEYFKEDNIQEIRELMTEIGKMLNKLISLANN